MIRKVTYMKSNGNISNFKSVLYIDITTATTHQKEKPLRGRKKSAAEVESIELSRFEPIVQDSFSLVMAAREGVLAKVAFEVADRLQLHLSQMAAILHVTTKTLQSYRQSKKKLSPSNSEKTLKLIALQLKGEEVMSAPDGFRRWLEKPAYGLDGQVPLALLETSGGIDLVMEELERIAYGDLA